MQTTLDHTKAGEDGHLSHATIAVAADNSELVQCDAF
jgi:hypothetical protein